MIEFENAGFAYGANVVLQGVTLNLDAGGLFVVLGQAGAGKTTFLRLCRGELAPSVGAIRHFGRPDAAADRVAAAALRRRIGLVAPDADFLGHLTVAENVALPLALAGAPAGERSGDVAAVLDWVGLGDLADAGPAELGRGGRLRAALARAVMASPDLILADEPSLGADEAAAGRVLTLLLKLHRMGRGVVIATREPALADWAGAEAGARVLRLAEGELAPVAGAASAAPAPAVAEEIEA